MTDNLFSKIEYHKANVLKQQSNIVLCNKSLVEHLKISNLTFKQPNYSSSEFPQYKYFKTLTLDNIVTLRATFDATNKQHQFWCKKIHRFLEFRLSSISSLIKKNYTNKKERVTFIQNVISLLLECYVNTKDSRYLSTALKLLRKKSIAKYGFLNTQYSPQYSYNIIVSHMLVHKNL